MTKPFLNEFSIGDLEAFSGVKAHTIRIWERRYGLLRPNRTGTNIRTYSIDDLRALLNVAYLNGRGLKISRIARMAGAERQQAVQELASGDKHRGELISALKIAMLTLDGPRFHELLGPLRGKLRFERLMSEVYLPLLEGVGLLWQTDAIRPAHEHFVSNLVRSDLIAATAALPPAPKGGPVFVLYLPEQEVHELGLLFADHLLRAAGQRTVYLGQGVPLSDLPRVTGLLAPPVVLLSYLTNIPEQGDGARHIQAVADIVGGQDVYLWFAGPRMKGVPPPPYPRTRVFLGITALVAAVAALPAR